jgi:putative ABC transport system ATP-binding protein
MTIDTRRRALNADIAPVSSPALLGSQSTAGRRLIELRGVTKKYRLGDEVVHALDNVSATLAAGEFVAINGPSGSGKSTFAHLIGGLDTPDAGIVIVDGLDLSDVRDHALSDYRNRRVGFVFQSFNLQVHETALENVMMPLVFAKVARAKRRTRARECLEAVGLGDRVQHTPAQLSGGQRQRVAIARALVMNPSIVIADEPTGNLDSSRGAEIIDLLVRLNRERGVTLLVVTHDDQIARRADRVLTICDGRITEEQR